MRVLMIAAVTIGALAVASPAQAAHKHKRHHAMARYDASTGPLIMSGSLVPYGPHRASEPICKPVTIRVR